MGRYEFSVDGLDGEECEKLIEAELEDLLGVLEAQANHREGLVEVVSDPDDAVAQASREVTEKEVVDALDRLGYEVLE